MELRYFDSHCHPQLSAYDADRDEVLARMRERGVGGLVVGTDLRHSREAVELANRHEFLWAAVGMHPNDNPEEEFDAQAYRELASHAKVVAIGECGLDYYRQEPTDDVRAAQTQRFLEHVVIAREAGKPLMIHCRPTKGTENANEEMLAILAREQVPAVMHFFTSTSEIARRYLELGCYLSFPGVITFTDMYDEAVRAAPLDRILSETDAPFAAPAPYRGKRNEPAYVEETVKRLAALKGISTETMAEYIMGNVKKAFAL